MEGILFYDVYDVRFSYIWGINGLMWSLIFIGMGGIGVLCIYSILLKYFVFVVFMVIFKCIFFFSF